MTSFVFTLVSIFKRMKNITTLVTASYAMLSTTIYVTFCSTVVFFFICIASHRYVMSLLCLCAFVTLNKRLLTYLLTYLSPQWQLIAATLGAEHKQSIHSQTDTDRVATFSHSQSGTGSPFPPLIFPPAPPLFLSPHFPPSLPLSALRSRPLKSS